MTHQEKLLDKYYKGETSLEEEKELKALLGKEDAGMPEGDIFVFYENEAVVPEGLEGDLFTGIQEATSKKKTFRMKFYSVVSAAAVVLIVLTVYLDFRAKKQTQMADNFFVMEQALFQISESLQPPQEQEEMLVLWVDDDVEIIIN